MLWDLASASRLTDHRLALDEEFGGIAETSVEEGATPQDTEPGDEAAPVVEVGHLFNQVWVGQVPPSQVNDTYTVPDHEGGNFTRTYKCCCNEDDNTQCKLAQLDWLNDCQLLLPPNPFYPSYMSKNGCACLLHPNGKGWHNFASPSYNKGSCLLSPGDAALINQ